MADEFKVTSQMTKKELIEKYSALFDAYKAKADEAQEAQKWRSEAEKLKASKSVEAAKKTTVGGVIEDVSTLRNQLGKTLNDLTEKLTHQSERLQELNGAVSVQEQRLKELYDIDAAAESFFKLTEAYGDRKLAMEEEYASRKEELEREIQKSRAAWKEEKKKYEAEWAELKAAQKKERERENEEYLYTRDKQRKLEEDEYQEKKRLLEKELKEKKTLVMSELAEREAIIQGREDELKELREKVQAFPARLQKEVTEAGKKAADEIRAKMAQDLNVAKMEREWEKKMFQQKIAFMEGVLKDKEKENQELKEEKTRALDGVSQIASKAIDGAAQFGAYSSVKEIAIEQARKGEGNKEQ